jgi:hypothetical protein
MPFFGSKLRKNWLVRLMFRSRETKVAPANSSSDALLSRNLGG